VAKIGGGRKIMIRCAGGRERIAEIARQNGAADVREEQDAVCVQFCGTDEELALLLKEFVHNGVAVTEFFCKKEGVQERYLETIRT
ncbi:hypothetical protein VU07_01960, partial [Desulfobulbus sp. F4]|nr:hypothetical protein [Desulfobulbus sp. F4]